MTKFLNKIVNGDSLEILKKIPDKTFNLIFADPPYNLQIGGKLKITGVLFAWKIFLKKMKTTNLYLIERDCLDLNRD